MSIENGTVPFGERELASRVGIDATRFTTDTMAVSELENEFGKTVLIVCDSWQDELTLICEQITRRYSDSDQSRTTLNSRAEQIADFLDDSGIASIENATGDLLLEWCERQTVTNKKTQAPSKTTVSNRRWSVRTVIEAAYDAGLLGATKRDELLAAVPKRRTRPPAGTIEPKILSGPLAEHSAVPEEDLQQIIKTIRHRYEKQSGALTERLPRARTFMRRAFGVEVKTWEDLDADLLDRCRSGNLTPAAGFKPLLKEPQAARGRGRAITAVIDAAVQLGYLDADHEAVSTCRQWKAPCVAPDSDAPEDIETAVNSWQPREWSNSDERLLPRVLPVVREWVLAASPPTVTRARNWMAFVAEAALREYLKSESTDPEIIFQPRQIDSFVRSTKRWRSPRSQYAASSALKLVGRVVVPHVIPPKSPPIGRIPVSEPYTAAEEEAFRIAAEAEGRSNRAARLWLNAAVCGAGLDGPEAIAAGPADIEQLGDNGLAIRVSGPNSRLVPIRGTYVDNVRAAIQLTTGQRFYKARSRNAASNIASQLRVDGLGTFSLRRARSTWICAHLREQTPNAPFRKFSGPIRAETLTQLLSRVADEIDEQTAALAGMIP